jgi:hypothetical protein
VPFSAGDVAILNRLLLKGRHTSLLGLIQLYIFQPVEFTVKGKIMFAVNSKSIADRDQSRVKPKKET